MKKLIYCLVVLSWMISCSPKRKAPEVLKIYPSSDTLPENLLRLYIKFSGPMKTVGNLEKINLLDQSKQKVEGAIFNNVYELWDASQTQLTLIFDPARVKSDLQVNKQFGRALKPGKNYELHLDNLEDFHHVPLRTFVKKIHVIEADTILPLLNKWKIISPKARTKSPMRILFPEAIDQMSLYHRIAIKSRNDELIEGEIVIKNQEKEWLFIPLNKWIPGSYFVEVNARLADPSGNSLNGLFDHAPNDLRFETEGELQRRPFQIKE